MKKYLLLTAMESEFRDVVTDGAFIEDKKLNTEYPLWRKITHDKSITLTRIGVGPINAAMNLSVLLEREHFDEIVLLGLGGGIDPKLSVGDIVIASSVVQHDAICSFDDRDELMACGELHLSVQIHDRKPIQMVATSRLNEMYKNHLEVDGLKVFSGIVASGSEFVGSFNKKNIIRKMIPGALLVDMESCSISYICTKKGISFSVIKTVADTLNKDASKEYIDCIESNSRKCANIFKLLDNL
jgi:adenosylhomocysteine nucleosidase